MSQMMLEIFERVRTFQLSKWRYCDPTLYSPQKLASIGYTCTSFQTAECSICHHKVTFNKETLQNQQELATNIFDHQQHCQHRSRSMRDIEESQLYLNMDDVISKVKNSYGKSKTRKQLPLVDGQSVWNAINKMHRASTFKTIMAKYEINPQAFRISFILTLFGWMLPEENKNTLQCYFCGRVVDFSNKHLVEDDQQISEEDQSLLFDPIKEHRYFCVWVSGLTGWNIYIQHLWDKLGESEFFFKREKPEEVQKIRVHLDRYFQNFNNKTGEVCEKIKGILNECQEIVGLVEREEKDKEAIRADYEKRKESLGDFLVSMEEEVRKPLKKIRID